MDEFDDNLIWADASDQISSSDSDTTSPTKMKETLEDSDLEKKCKKELQQELFKQPKLESDSEISSKKKKKLKEKISVSIKSEPESDLESVKKRKKSKRKSSINEQPYEGATPTDDSYLELRIKEEVSASPSKKHKKGKKEKHVTSHIDNTHSENGLESNGDSKKKSKKKKNKFEKEVLDVTVVKELFSAEETLVGTLEVEDDTDTPQRKKKKKKNKKRDISPVITQNGYQSDHENNVSTNVQDDAMMVDEPHNEVSIGSKANNTPNISSRPRESRISDRLLFEDDSQMETIQSGTYSTHSYKLQQFLKSHDLSIEPININYPNDVSISSDDEVFLLNCPTEVDIEHFEDLSLSLDKSCRFKLGGHKYESSVNSDSGNNVTLLLFGEQKHSIKSFSCQARINFRKRLPKAHFVMDNMIENEQTNFIPLPDTKCRHPLFGPDYKKAIKLPAAVKERLQNSLNADATLVKKKKKKKHKMEIEEIIDDKESNLEDIKVRRKRRRSSRGDDAPSSKRARPPPAWDDERAIEQNLFDF